MSRPVTIAAFGLALIAAAPAAAQTKLTTMIGEWRGAYVCAQGQTGLTLTIDKENGDGFTGYFHFYPLKTNAIAKEGCYSVEGRRAADGRVVVSAQDWITRPPNYVTVDLAGRLGSTGYYMTGDVVAPPELGASCHKFELNWQSPRPIIASACLEGRTASAR